MNQKEIKLLMEAPKIVAPKTDLDSLQKAVSIGADCRDKDCQSQFPLQKFPNSRTFFAKTHKYKNPRISAEIFRSL